MSGQVRKAYVWGHMLISQRQLVAGNWVTHYYGQDGSENVRQLFDNLGAVTDTFDYDAFGILIGRTGTTANSYLYRSQQFDADLGIYYNRARYYDQTRGRFLSRDAFDGISQFPASLHKYLYAEVNPVKYQDSSGYLSSLGRALTATALVGGAAVSTGTGAATSGASAAAAFHGFALAASCVINITAAVIAIGGSALYESCSATGRQDDKDKDKDKDDDEDDEDEDDKKPEQTYYFRGTTVGYSGNDSLVQIRV